VVSKSDRDHRLDAAGVVVDHDHEASPASSRVGGDRSSAAAWSCRSRVEWTRGSPKPPSTLLASRFDRTAQEGLSFGASKSIRPSTCSSRQRLRKRYLLLGYRRRRLGVVIDDHTAASRRWSAVRTSKPRSSTWRPRDGASPVSIKPFHADDGARRGRSPRTPNSPRTAELPLRQKRQGNLHRPQRRRRLPRSCSISCGSPTPTTRSTRGWRWKAWSRRSRTAPARSPRRSTRRAIPTRSSTTRRWCWAG